MQASASFSSRLIRLAAFSDFASSVVTPVGDITGDAEQRHSIRKKRLENLQEAACCVLYLCVCVCVCVTATISSSYWLSISLSLSSLHSVTERVKRIRSN